MVHDGYDAVTLAEVSSPAIVEGVERLLHDEELAQRLSENAYKGCEVRYSSAEVARQTISADQKNCSPAVLKSRPGAS